MCGICGFTNADFSDAPTLEAMCEAIAHRGPDGRGTIISNGIALGHTRLALIDIEGGSQPFTRKTVERECAIVFNGEIYNHAELRQQLEPLGWAFKSRSDTEVLLIAYMQWGEGCLERLRGMFAFAIWDGSKRELFCARDHFGIKPFYFFQQGRNFVFASEAKSILEHPAYQKKLNMEALSQYLCFQFPATHQTFFEGIFKLPAAHWLRVDSEGDVTVKRYWTPSFNPDSKLGQEEAVLRIQEAMKDSVSVHGRADVEVGALLSGGVDSSYVTGLLAKDAPNAHTFSVGFEGDGGFQDEIDCASAVSRELNVKNDSMRIVEREWWGVLDDVLWHMDEPIGDPSAASLYLLDRLASCKVKAVVSGEGADELFGGYRIYQAPLASKRLQWVPRKALRAAEKLARRLDVRGAHYLYRACWGPRYWYYTNANQLAFDPHERDMLLRNPPQCEYPQNITAPYYEQAEGLGEETQMQFVDMNLWLVEDILLKTDKMAMAHSLEARVPYLDRRVFDVASALPTDLKVTSHGTKVAFRQAAAKALPTYCAEKEKLGFPVPLCNWLRQDGVFRKLERAFKGNTARTYFNSGTLMRLLKEHYAGANNSRRLWIAYSFLRWHRLFFE